MDGSAGNQPSLDQLKAWLSSGQTGPNIVRNPAQPYEITRVNTGATNASTVTVKAYDIQADYSLNLGDIGLDNWGQMRFNLRATNLDSFQYQERVSAPVVVVVGRQNFATGGAPAAPDWKANLTIGWTNGNHNITAITRYVDDMIYDGSDFSFIQRYANTTYRKVDTINRWVDADINLSLIHI